ncbi:MAG: hypothetical protein L0Z53_14540 [Acidobacteriales bacterium]|nr:hypothetical protein [Terriglobales bacterium]
MPKTIGERAVRYAKAVRVIFKCPYSNCGQQTSYLEQEVDADGVCCRSCKQFFLPISFHKALVPCAACGRRLEAIHYREGVHVHHFCADCAAVFDKLVSEAEVEYHRWLRAIVARVRAARRLASGCAATVRFRLRPSAQLARPEERTQLASSG